MSYLAGSLQLMFSGAASPSRLTGPRRVIDDVAEYDELLCKERPEIIKTMRITAVIADQMEAAGGLLAQAFSLPFISAACALPVNRESAVPLPVMPWPCANSQRAIKLNKTSTSTNIYDWLTKPHACAIAQYSKILGLPLERTLADCLSPSAQLSQSAPGFDFPRTSFTAHFYHVGPLRSDAKTDSRLNYPVNLLRPFIFASLGTLQGGRSGFSRRVAQACKAMQVQLLMAHRNFLNTRPERLLRQACITWVTGFSDQQAAVQMASAIASPGGLNTVLNGLAAGKPLLALAVAFDHPRVAARIVHAKAGLKLSPRWATEASIANALSRFINKPSFAGAAARLTQNFALAGGAYKASRIVLSAIAQPPVLKTRAAERAPLYLHESPVYAT